MDIATVSSPERGAAHRALAAFAARLIDQRLRVVGALQISTATADARHCDMDLSVLPDGPVIRINQNLGPGSRGCRLDAGALETAVAATEAAFAGGADLLIVNKFGKLEAEGRGFRALIAEALCRNVPVLVVVNGLNRDAFEAFVDGGSIDLPADPHALDRWFAALRRAQRVSAAQDLPPASAKRFGGSRSKAKPGTAGAVPGHFRVV